MERQREVDHPSALAGAGFALVSLALPPYGSPPEADAGRGQARCCYVLRGTLAVTVGERTVTLRAGEAMALPPALALSYWNPSAGPVEVLLIVGCSGAA